MNVNEANDYATFVNWKKQRELNVDVWQSLNYFKKSGDDLKWFAKIETTSTDEFCVFFTNLIELWSEELTLLDFETKLRAFNPNLEGGDAKIFTKFVKELTLGRQNSTVVAEFDDARSDESMRVSYRTKFAGVPFRWEFNGCKCSKSESKKQIVDPLLVLLTQFQRREMDLFDMLAKKDREIEAYKMSGATLNRKSLETPKFDAESWTAHDGTSEAFLDVCRDFRAERCHPFQDVRMRSLCSATETVMHYLDAYQVLNEDVEVESTSNVDVAHPNDDLPKLSPISKRNAADALEDEKDDEPDTTTVTTGDVEEKRPVRKKKKPLRL